MYNRFGVFSEKSCSENIGENFVKYLRTILFFYQAASCLSKTLLKINSYTGIFREFRKQFRKTSILFLGQLLFRTLSESFFHILKC